MKGFVKVSLITAGSLTVAGLILCMMGALLGGGDFDNMIREDVRLEENLDRVADAVGDITDRVAETKGARAHHGSDHDMIVGDTATSWEAQESLEGIQKLDLTLGAGNFAIIEKEVDDGMIDIYVEGKGNYDYRVKGDTFYMTGFEGIKTIGADIYDNAITLALPPGIHFKEVDMTVGAGNIEVYSLSAGEIDADVGAGALFLENVSADELSTEIGAGRAEISGTNVGELSVTVGMGECVYDGSVDRKLEAECDMGNIELSLKGEEKDYNYALESVAGNIDINGRQVTGFTSEQTIDNKASATVEVECNMGNVWIGFY